MNTRRLRELIEMLAKDNPGVQASLKTTAHRNPISMEEMIAGGHNPDLAKFQPEDILRAAANELMDDRGIRERKGIKALIDKATGDNFYDKADLSVGFGKGSGTPDREDIIQKASLYGTKLGDTEKMLKYATRIGDTDKMAQASEAYKATRLAQALGDDDIKFIVDHADVLNKQGKEALIQLLLERKDTANLYGLNNKLDNEFINKDLKNKFTRDQSKLLDEAIANNELQRKFYSKLDDDEVAAELRGMSVDPRTDPARSRLIADRMRNGQTVDTSVDEMFNADITNEQLAKHPRYKSWMAEEERRLRGKVPSSPVKDIHPTRAQAAKRNRASDIKDREEILEQVINNRYGSVDNLRKTLRNGLEGPDRFYDEEAGLLSRYEDAMDEAGYSTGKPGKVPNYKLKRLDKEDALDREQLVRLAAEDPEKNELAIKKLESKMKRRDIDRKNAPKEIYVNPRSKDADELGDIDEDNVMNQFLDPRDQERIKPTPRSRDYGEEGLMLRDRARADRILKAREARGMKGEKDLPARTVDRIKGIKQTPDDRRKELTEIGTNSKDKDVPVYKGGKYPDYFMTEKEALRDMYPRHTKVNYEKIPAKSGEYKDPMKNKATEGFIRNVAKQLGFRPSDQLIEQLKKYSKRAVVDWYENLADPYIKPKSRR